MELKIKPFYKNTFPLKGILIKGTSATIWMKEIQWLQLSLHDIDIFPIPDTAPNSIWGCLVISHGNVHVQVKNIGINEWCQMVAANFFIAEKSILYPTITFHEIEKLFSKAVHIFHPAFGLVELTEKLNLKELITTPTLKPQLITKPHDAIFIPKQIKSFQIHAVPPEDVLKNMEENVFPKRKKMEDKPLNIFEKGKLAFYKLLFNNIKEGNGNNENAKNEKTGLWGKISDFLNSTLQKNTKLADKLQQDFEDLEKRNQKQIDKLMELFKNNPEEALKYAIPLDDLGSSRGGNEQQLNLSKRWMDFSLFSNNNPTSGGGSINLGDHYYELQKQYNATAEALIKQKQYQKAAFIYLKLLKNHHLAAQTLEDGKYYQEAATIYLKHANNKAKAAECYEKGNMINDAIEIYKELNDHEKVGDLYVGIHKRKEADMYFEKVVENYKSNNQYVKASLVYKNKMNNEMNGQSLLLEGWRGNKDAFNCLNNYFNNIPDIKTLKTELNNIYINDVKENNRESFLQVIRYEFNKKNELSESIKEIAYEIVAAQININPSIVSELKGFNSNDKELVKDTMRFKINRK